MGIIYLLARNALLLTLYLINIFFKNESRTIIALPV